MDVAGAVQRNVRAKGKKRGCVSGSEVVFNPG